VAFTPQTTDLTGQLVLLGTGTSVGVPMIGCDCAVCRSEDPRNHRLRSAAAIGLPEGLLLIDTPPDLRTQLLREDIGVVHSVFYTHEHADHLYGLDDLRLFQFYLGHPVPIYAESHVAERIKTVFHYAFEEVEATHAGAAPKLDLRLIDDSPFEILGARLTPVRLYHGPRFQVLGVRVGNVAYCTDVKSIPPESMERLRGLDTLVLGALRHKPHATHLSLGEAVAVVEELRPRRAYFTHVSHELEYEETNLSLPAGVELAYDGLRIPLI